MWCTIPVVPFFVKGEAAAGIFGRSYHHFYQDEENVAQFIKNFLLMK